MKIGFFDDYKLGVIRGEAIIDVSPAVADIPRLGPHDLINGLITRYEAYRPRLEEAASRGKATSLGSVRLRAPLPRPNMIRDFANYELHVRQVPDGPPALHVLPQRPERKAVTCQPLTVVAHDIERRRFDLRQGSLKGPLKGLPT